MHPFEKLTVPDQSVGIHWFGQSSFALKDVTGFIVYVDPYFPRDRPPDRFIHAEPPIDETDLHVDAALLTHDHGDHTCPETLARIAHSHPSTRYVGPPEAIDRLRQLQIPEQQLVTIEAGMSKPVGSMLVNAVWSKPPKGLPADGIEPPDTTHLGYVVDTNGVRVYVSGDPVNTFAEHDELLEPIRALNPDIGLLTTHPHEGEFPFFEGSAKTASRLSLKAAIPAHYNCFVRRNYDPHAWSKVVEGQEVKSIIIPYNRSLLYPTNSPSSDGEGPCNR